MERKGFTLLELLVVMSTIMTKIDGDDYTLWRPKLQQIGTHQVTVAFSGETTSEKEVTVCVGTREALKALQKDKKTPH